MGRCNRNPPPGTGAGPASTLPKFRRDTFKGEQNKGKDKGKDKGKGKGKEKGKGKGKDGKKGPVIEEEEEEEFHGARGGIVVLTKE